MNDNFNFLHFRYISAGCGAMKLILKNFASVIKSNIDSPVQTVGVDISREERYCNVLKSPSNFVDCGTEANQNGMKNEASFFFSKEYILVNPRYSLNL